MDRDSECRSEDGPDQPIRINNNLPEDQDAPKICDNQEKYKCQFCDKGFTRKSNMERHLMRHTGERPFDCPHCDKKFSLKSTLQNHLRLHTGEKPYTCDVCQKTFRQRSNYVMHRKIHTGDGRYICEVCGRQFIQKGHFELHLHSHSGIKAFSCQHCGKRFSQSILLKQHSEIHKEGNERKFYICSVCDKKFCTSRTLEYHLKAHAGIKDFQCKTCGATFQQRSALNRHMKPNGYSHTAKCQYKGLCRKRAYECNYCLREFGTKAMLRNHIYSHTGEKPYECKDCNKKFVVKSSLKLHQKLYCKLDIDICREETTTLCDVDRPVVASKTVTSRDSVHRRTSVAFEKSCMNSDSLDLEGETGVRSGVQKSDLKENVHNTSIPSKSFTSLDFRPYLSTSSSSSSDESVPIGGIEKMTKHLHINRDFSSVCTSGSPSENLAVVIDRKGVFEGLMQNEITRVGANRDCNGSCNDSSRVMNHYSSRENSSSDDGSIKEEIDIVYEDIDEWNSP